MALAAAVAAPAQTHAPDVIVAVGAQAAIEAPGFLKSEVIDSDLLEVMIGPEKVVLSAREVGQTTLILWDAERRAWRYLVKIVPPGQLDAELQQAILAALAGDPVTAGQPINVTVANRAATLTGQVASQAVIDRAAALASRRVDQLVNQLQVAGSTPPLPAPQPQEQPQPRPRPIDGELPPVTGPSSDPLLPPLPGEVGLRFDEMQVWSPLGMGVNEARSVTVPTQLFRALIANPDIADVIAIPPREVVITAKQPGTTTLMVWYRGADPFLGEVESARVDVTVAGVSLSGGGSGGVVEPIEQPGGGDGDRITTPKDVEQVLQMLGISGIEVIVRREGASSPSIILAGTVDTDSDKARAEQAVAALYPTDARISNFIQVKPAISVPQVGLAERAASLERMIAEHVPNAAVRVQLRADQDGRRFRVYLGGEAATPHDRIRAEQLVEFELGGQAAIVNDIMTPLPPPPAELLGGAAAQEETKPPLPPVAEAVARAVEIAGVRSERVYIDIHDDRKLVVVAGSVRSDEDREELLMAIDEALSVYDEPYEIRERNLVVKTPLVVTEVEIVEMSAQDTRNLGLIWGVPTSNEGGGGGGTNSGPTQVDNNAGLSVYGERLPGDPFRRLDPLAVSVRALVNNNRGKILSRPTITSDNGEQGVVEIGTEVPLPSTTTTQGGVGTSVEFRPVGIRLLVTPEIVWGEPDSQIQMNIETEVSALDFGNSVIINGSPIPAVTQRRAQTVATVNNGDTLVIGGLTTEQERRNVSRIPFLSDIPILGSLFKHTDKSKEQSTVVVVMTPRIIW